MTISKKIIFTVVSIGVSNLCYAEDVYNFYFNKNNQNQKAQIVRENDKVITNSSAEITAKENYSLESTRKNKKENIFNGWEVSFGSAIASSDGYSESSSFIPANQDDIAYSNVSKYYHSEGLSIGIGKNFNKYLGMDLNISSLSFKDTNGASPEEDFMNFRAGISITPIRFNVLGHDLLEMGALVGMGSFQKIQYESIDQYDSDSNTFQTLGITDEVTVVRPYLGIRFAINMTNRFAFHIDSTAIQEDDVGITNSNFSIRYQL